MRFSAEVIETVAIRKLYFVEAENEAEALELLESGETEAETDLRTEGVIDRTVDRETLHRTPLGKKRPRTTRRR